MKMKKKYFALLILLVLALLSCTPGDSQSSNQPGNGQLSVVLNTEIVGTTTLLPNGDGSGIVKFNFTPSSGVSYKVAFGDGEVIETTNGTITHIYKSSGTRTYKIDVTGFDGLKYFNATKSIVVFVAITKIWGDEFDVDGAPNSSNWGYDLGAGGWGNNEEQYYTNRASNVIVEGGYLKIKTIKESYLGSNFTSARILSKDKFSFKYGKVEFRAKLPAGGGTWPALWMLGDNVGTVSWPACGEIDVMEHVANQLNKIYATLHFPGRSGGNGDSSFISIDNSTTTFHIYSVDWRADTIKFYVDNQLFKTFVNSASVPFNDKFFLIINCAIGGGFGGAIDPNFVSSTFEVDYVRVYN
jgi:hypothetical protein